MSIEAFTPVDVVMRECPATIRVFIDHGFYCVGCPIGSFHTVEDACREHKAELGAFLTALRRVAGGAADPDEPVRPGRRRLRRAASGGAGRGG